MQELNQEVEHKLYKKVYFKYQFIKIRAKISYMAFKQRLTIQELILNAIMKTVNELHACGDFTMS